MASFWLNEVIFGTSARNLSCYVEIGGVYGWQARNEGD